MSLLSKVFPMKAHLAKQAKDLAKVANIISISSFTTLAAEYPFLEQCDLDDWDFFMTAGAIFIALNNLQIQVSGDQFIALYPSAELQEWHAKGEDAISDCQKFVHKLTEDSPGTVDPTDALGMWVLWNLLRREPTFEEAQAARGVGTILVSGVEGWWEEQ